MTYSKLKDAQQATFNNFKGIIFAYSNKQLAEGLTKLNASKSEITMCNTGMFVLKTRECAMYTLLETSNKEMKDELCNHEYCITGNTRDALTALDLTSEEVPKHVMKASRIAASKDY